MSFAPLGRRLCEVTANRASGGYRVFSVRDAEGPEPAAGQFYMLASQRCWSQGERPYLPRALSVAGVGAGGGGLRLDFLAEAIGPGTRRLCSLEEGEHIWVNGPLGNGFTAPAELGRGLAGAILVGGGIGIAPLALWRRELARRGVPARVLLGFRDRAHSGGLDDLFRCSEVGISTEDGHLGQRGYVTDLLTAMLAGDDLDAAAVYSCGPPAMLEAVREMCTERGVACELALESPMACGFGACFGCAVPLAAGGYMRLCVDGPVLRADQIAGVAGG